MKTTLRYLIRRACNFVRALYGGKPLELLLAQEKRAYERKLRAAGHSRAQATAMVSERYSNRGQG